MSVVVLVAGALTPEAVLRLCARYVFPRPLAMSESKPPPPGIYVPAILFFKENEDIDEEAQKSHILHLAQVQPLDFLLRERTPALTAAPNAPICRDPSTGSSSRDRMARRSTFHARSGSASFVSRGIPSMTTDTSTSSSSPGPGPSPPARPSSSTLTQKRRAPVMPSS